MKKKDKKKVLIIISLMVLVGILASVGVFQSVFGYEDYFENTLSYSDVGKYSDAGYPEGLIVTGIDNCGGRQNGRGVTSYTTCDHDKENLILKPYEICVDQDIANLGLIRLSITGNTVCDNMGNSRYNCQGQVNFYDDERNQIGSLTNSMRLYSDGYRDTGDINKKITLDLSQGYESLDKLKCFDIYAAELSKPSGTGADLKRMTFNYNINSFELFYDAVGSVVEPVVEVEQPEEGSIVDIIEGALIGGQCTSNVECVASCGSAVPTCSEGLCSCDGTVVSGGKTSPLVYIIPGVFIALILLIIYRRLKR